jgi:hypothetical protein
MGMLKKEDVGRALKKAARILPGIGSYHDRESIRESDKVLRMRICRKLDELLGMVEWLKTDQTKKGVLKHLTEIDGLSRHLERVSRTIELASRGYTPLFSQEAFDEDGLARLFEFDQGLLTGVAEVEALVVKLTEKGTVVTPEGVASVREQVDQLEKKMKTRASLLKNEAV